ncbi:PAS domain S-box protein [Sorangium sp. So ce117]|uniref:PAS domain S-box protein n=1 Tax=Sorangium sp. So ce117 TaxID=3133277 RepID=UPI003F61554C
MTRAEVDTEVAELQRRVAELEHQLAQVRQERDEYEQIVQRAPALISRLTPDGRVVYANTTCEQIIGYKLEEVIGQELLPILYPGELMEPVKEYLRIAAEGGDVRDYELALRTRDGELRTLTWNSFHRFGPDGELLEIVSLGVDVTARKASEAAHQRLQEQIIAMQAAALVALSTPLIPISKGVVVMPLIGSVDEERARQIMETLLSGISRSQASTAILDITGVATVDQGVAHALLQAARAARMLGAQVVLTGIRPDVAQTLVSLGTHLEGIITRGTLESGIAFALAREQAGAKE